LMLIFGFSLGLLLHPMLPPFPEVSYNNLANLLPSKPRILCWILTSPGDVTSSSS